MFTPEVIASWERLAGYLAVALSKARTEEDLRQSEEELRNVAEDLRRSNADLQQFAYIASHDLQSPLRNVEGFSKLLARRYKDRLDEKGNEFVFQIANGVKEMQALIRDVLEFSRVGSGSAFTSVDAALCVDKALANLKEEMAEKKAEIIVDEALPKVSGDPAQLVNLFQNLIGNSIKFSSERPKIHISAKKEDGRWVFSVKDNGIGVDPEYAGKVFDIFQRLHSKADYPGTGIGLAICKKIVERHGGRIWVEPAPDKGATFSFTLQAQE
jgi:light-regulated signal transduction histidine kinase (bacteriophytochrome)